MDSNLLYAMQDIAGELKSIRKVLEDNNMKVEEENNNSNRIDLNKEKQNKVFEKLYYNFVNRGRKKKVLTHPRCTALKPWKVI